MFYFDKKIRYLSYFEGSIRMQNAGYVKFQVRDTLCQMAICVKGGRMIGNCDAEIYLEHMGNDLQQIMSENNAALLGNISIRNGQGYLVLRMDAENMGNTGLYYDDITGICIKLREYQYLESRWNIDTRMPGHENRILHEKRVVIDLGDGRSNEEAPAASKLCEEQIKSGRDEAESIASTREYMQEQMQEQAPEQEQMQEQMQRQAQEQEQMQEYVQGQAQEQEQMQEYVHDKVQEQERVQGYMQEQTKERVQGQMQGQAQEHRQEQVQGQIHELAPERVQEQVHGRMHEQVHVWMHEQVQEHMQEREQVQEQDLEMRAAPVNREPANAAPVNITPPIVDMNFKDDKWEQLRQNYPIVHPLGANQECLKIEPKDFIIFRQKYQSLVNNSFLLHGFYNYKHLILCRKTKEEEPHFYLGVPGTFHEREKKVAVMFGFEAFEGEREPAENGDFGYYLVTVEL